MIPLYFLTELRISEFVMPKATSTENIFEGSNLRDERSISSAINKFTFSLFFFQEGIDNYIK